MRNDGKWPGNQTFYQPIFLSQIDFHSLMKDMSNHQ